MEDTTTSGSLLSVPSDQLVATASGVRRSIIAYSVIVIAIVNVTTDELGPLTWTTNNAV